MTTAAKPKCQTRIPFFSSEEKYCYPDFFFNEVRGITVFRDKFQLLLNAKVNNQMAALVNMVVSKLPKSCSNKMATFYVITDEKSIAKTYVAVSGFKSEFSNADVQELTKNNVTLIAFSGRKEIKSSGNENVEKRLELFKRFLIEGTTSTKHAQNLTEFVAQFKLHVESILQLIKISELFTNAKFETFFAKYKKYCGCQEKMELIINLFLRPFVINYLELLPKDDNSAMNEAAKCVAKMCQPLIEGKNEFLLEEFAKIVDNDATAYQFALQDLWDAVKTIDNLGLARMLSHCSENNLIDYLANNLGIMQEPGIHRIFSIRVKDSFDEISEPCDVCSLLFKNDLDQLITNAEAKQSDLKL